MNFNKNKTIFEKTSFLQGTNSPFIEKLYLEYLQDPSKTPESWREFFKGLNEDEEIVWEIIKI